MIRSMLAFAVVALGITAVAAQSDPISTRKGLMKRVGDLTKVGASMDKGDAPFDAAKAHEIFAAYIDTAAKMPTLFPDNAKTGGETSAAPKIWEDMAGFKERFAKFSADAKAAEAATKDLASFKAQFGGLTKSCGGCHEVYRVKKS
jgi:cytochrome c556